MGKLQHLMDRESGTADLAKSLTRSRDTVDMWLKTINEVSGALATLMERMETVEVMLGGLEIPDHSMELSELGSRVDVARNTLQAEIRRTVASAVNGIKFPAIPAPPEVDLAPVMALLQELRDREDEEPEEEPEDERPREWRLEVHRDNFGMISSVTAKAL